METFVFLDSGRWYLHCSFCHSWTILSQDSSVFRRKYALRAPYIRFLPFIKQFLAVTASLGNRILLRVWHDYLSDSDPFRNYHMRVLLHSLLLTLTIVTSQIWPMKCTQILAAAYCRTIILNRHFVPNLIYVYTSKVSDCSYSKRLALLNANDIEIDLHLFLHDRGSGFHHGPYDVLLPAQEQAGHKVYYVRCFRPRTLKLSWYIHGRTGAGLLRLMRLVLISGLATRWIYIYIDLPCICSNTLDSVCSLIILITVRFTGILTFTRPELRNFRSLSYGRSLWYFLVFTSFYPSVRRIHYLLMMTDKEFHSVYQFTACNVHHFLEAIACSLPFLGWVLDPSNIRLIDPQMAEGIHYPVISRILHRKTLIAGSQSDLVGCLLLVLDIYWMRDKYI